MGKDSEPNQGASDNASQGATSWLSFMGMILFVAGCISTGFISDGDFKEKWNHEVKMTYHYVGPKTTQTIYDSCDSWGEKTVNYFDLRKQAVGTEVKFLKKAILTIPEIVKWIYRRLIMMFPILILGMVLGVLMFFRGTLKKMTQDMMKVESQMFFEIGRIMMWSGFAYVGMSAFSSLPLYADTGYFLIGLSAIPLITNIFRLRVDFFIPVFFTAGSIFLGPWNAAIGLIFIAFGSYILARQTPYNT